MKKGFFIGLFLMLLLLTGCGTGDNWKPEFTKEIYFIKGAKSAVEIKVTEEGEPVTDLSAIVSFEMTKMNHGTVNLKLKESKDGLYSGEAVFPMAGDYVATFTLKKEGYTIEKQLEVNVKKSEGVATINGEPITEDTLEFYRFINLLHIAMNREADQKEFTGKELEERLAKWAEEEKQTNDRNGLLVQIIRLRAMALLATEKGHEATTAEVNNEINNIRSKYNQSEVAKKLITEFGEDKFWDIEQKQYEMIVLTQKVQQDVKAKVKKENPTTNEQEINYLASKQYDELLESQIGSLKIEIF
jgi:hypothetical protein